MDKLNWDLWIWTEGKEGKKEVPKVAVAATQNTTTKESFEELIKYKDLLDNGIITQEEFEEKKKQILGTSIPSTKGVNAAEENDISDEIEAEEAILQTAEKENNDVTITEEPEVADNGQI